MSTGFEERERPVPASPMTLIGDGLQLVGWQMAYTEATPNPAPARTDTYSRPAVKIVPKGLRSFDKNDADYFLELLPGPRDRDGLPDSLRFWKTRIETTEPDAAFKVGLIYGPSGCGKSSMVKAGLIPRLAKPIRTVYIEATLDETEARLLKGLRKVCPGLSQGWDLVESLANLRRCHILPPERKVLLVLDQFEQWLHARRGDENPDLVAALRRLPPQLEQSNCGPPAACGAWKVLRVPPGRGQPLRDFGAGNR